MKKELYNHIESPIWIKNRDNKISFINESFKKIFDVKDVRFQEHFEFFSSLIRLRSPQIIVLNGREYVNKIISKEEDFENIVNILVDLGEVKEKTESNNDNHVLRTIIDNIPQLIFYKDKDLKYLGINQACQNFYNSRGVYDIIGKNDLDFPLERDFLEACYRHDKQVLEGRKTLYIEEDVLLEGHSERSYFQTVKTPITNDEGEIEGLVGIVFDITEHKNIEKKLREISYLDKLTNLYNRAYFDEKINELTTEKQFPIGIITGDVNGLKIINDTIGHVQGDELLKSVADIFKKVSKDQYFVFRWGGDEFVTLIPNASEEMCQDYMNQVEEMCRQSNDEFFKLSIAQGYAMLTKTDKIDDILRESENKVYREKILQNKSVRTSVMATLKKNLQLKNIETEEHTDRVAKYCKRIGKAMKLDHETLEQLVLIAKSHDIGKIGIPEEILLKSEKLTPDEYEIMKTHSERGYRFALLIPELSHVTRGILTHHERWDGKGYPLGIAGEEIPLTARIVAVVDAFDEMNHDRVYSKARSREEAIAEIINGSGKHFDPDIVDIFCKVMKQENDGD